MLFMVSLFFLDVEEVHTIFFEKLSQPVPDFGGEEPNQGAARIRAPGTDKGTNRVSDTVGDWVLEPVLFNPERTPNIGIGGVAVVKIGFEPG